MSNRPIRFLLLIKRNVMRMPMVIIVPNGQNTKVRARIASPSKPFPKPFPQWHSYCRLIQTLGTIGLDDLLVCEEAVLAATLVGTGAVVVLIDVDETVALAHLARAGGNQVDGTPPGVGNQVNAIGNGRPWPRCGSASRRCDTGHGWSRPPRPRRKHPCRSRPPSAESRSERKSR